jgi:hypothetical protein
MYFTPALHMPTWCRYRLLPALHQSLLPRLVVVRLALLLLKLVLHHLLQCVQRFREGIVRLMDVSGMRQ